MICIRFNENDYYIKELTLESIDELWQEVKRKNPNETRDKKEFLKTLKELDSDYRHVMGGFKPTVSKHKKDSN